MERMSGTVTWELDAARAAVAMLLTSSRALASPAEHEAFETDDSRSFWATGERPGLALLHRLTPVGAPPLEFLNMVIAELVPLGVAMSGAGATRDLEELALELALES